MTKIRPRNFKARKPTIKKTAIDNYQDKRIAKIEKDIKAISETKYKLISQGAVAIANNAPHTALLNGFTRGTSNVSRSGVKVKAKYIDMRFTATNNSNTFTNDNAFRILIVREKPALGLTISYTSLFDTTIPTHLEQFNYIDRDFKKRFFIVYDKTFNTWNQSNLCQVSLHIKRKLNFISNYSRADTGLIDDIDTNSLFLLVFTEKGAGSASALSIKYELLIFFEDA